MCKFFILSFALFFQLWVYRQRKAVAEGKDPFFTCASFPSCANLLLLPKPFFSVDIRLHEKMSS